MLQSLLPIKLKKGDPSHQTVKELAEVLDHAIKNEDIRNIALTGPFGSGKSSILQTLMEEHKEFRYLPISLATLQADEEGKRCSSNSQEDKSNAHQKDGTLNCKDSDFEALNRKIEYSILQQIIYREKAETVPNSRFKRIVHIEKENLRFYSVCGLLFVLAFIAVFFPNLIEGFYRYFHLVNYKSLITFFASLYLIWASYHIFRYIIKSYSNSKLNKLNLKDAQIEIEDENSIFNKHLDEILYFFQVTSYNVVVIEDLDRFETEKIYLKLRELNQLVNESKIVGRHIVFLYAIKDDVFEDEARTKFFDYITTVIPVINPSNSKAKLKAALKDRGFGDNEIPDDDLSEMAFFIQDMRILTNIANEYSQYRKKLYNPDKNNLNLTKLLAMIVYKNYFPKDFAQLHRRDGLIYKCISSKHLFVAEALKVLDSKKKELEEKKKRIEDNNHLKESDLRYLFLQELREAVSVSMLSIQIDNQYYSLKHISQNEGLFEKLSKLTSIQYQYYSPYYGNQSQSGQYNFESINKKIKYKERINAIKAAGKAIQDEEKALQKEKLKIQSLKLYLLLKIYHLGDSELYKGLNLAPLMDVFVRQGFIDEDYYDYISYFYPGMVSLADQDLLLSIKRQIKQDYTYHIDKIDNFVKELKPYMFEHDAVLNNELLDYLARKKNAKGRDMFTQMMGRLERTDAPLGFLSQYYQYGKQQKDVFADFIEWNKEVSWRMIETHPNNDEKQLLREGWLKYCDETTEIQSLWLNENYSFLSSRVENIGLEKCKELIKACLFTDIDDKSKELLNEVIEQWHYDINTNNLCLIVNFLNKDNSTNSDNLNLTRITDTHHAEFEKCVKHAFTDAFMCFSTSTKDESAENILYILNYENLKPEQKISYLSGQVNQLDSFTDVNEECWNIAIKSKIITPTWENIDSYFNKSGGVTDEMLSYIEHYYPELEEECSDDIESKGTLFNELLGSSKLSLKTYRSISKAFNNKFDGFKTLGQLDRERLLVLLADDKIAFTEANIEILQKMSIYPNYLIHYHKDFLNKLEYVYHIDVDDALTLLDSNEFSLQEKRKIIGIISPKVMAESQLLADKIIVILLATNDIMVGQNALNGVLSIAENEKNKVIIASQMLSNYSYNNDGISSLLSLLGGKFAEIAERRKHPVIENNAENVALLSRLEDLGFISSKTPEKDGLRVHPKRN
jgi:hypothetical protein